MLVIKRNGNKETVSFDKVLSRVRKASKGLSVNPDALAQQVLSQIFDGVKTSELDELTAQLAASLSTLHPDYGTLAARISISNHHKNTTASFSEVMIRLSSQKMPQTGDTTSFIHPELLAIVKSHGPEIDSKIHYDRDYLFDYFGFKTLERSYLLKDTSMVIQERPQHMWMRVALALWSEDLPRAFETYDLLSQKFLTHATPTLFNAGTPRQQLSSCFLLAMAEDSIKGIYKTLGDCAAISKFAGGIGLHLHNVRARGSLIKGTNGQSNGLVPMLRVFNNTARYVDQGGGKRNGSFAMYLEPWHADVEDFLKMKLNTGSEEDRARDLFYALWIPDLFMERVEADGDWSLFCPNEAPGLSDVWGDEFKELYERYEREGRARKVVKAQKLWFQTLDSQMETGTPYLLYKDAANRKSNQQNVGTIKSSNLCTEIIEYSSPEETAVCNLASLALPSFVMNGVFDFTKLREVTRTAIRNLNRVIDINFYPTPETERSNMRHRPVGLGVQGLADVFALLGLAWEQEEAAKLNQLIFEHMYYAAVEASSELAKVEGSYETFEGSPASKGKLQPDLWSVTPITEKDGSLNWSNLRESVKTHGLRNSLLIAPMPTASTSQILGFNECFEPFTSNLYTRRTLAGEFIVINRYLLADLMKEGLWSEEMKQQIVARNGSVQDIPGISEELQLRYKTSWEMKQKVLIDMAAARGAFICQSQSLNLFVADPAYSKLTSMHFYAWKQGLKTGCYYLRTKAPVTAQKFTVDPRLMAAVQSNQTRSNTESEDAKAFYESDSDSDDEMTPAQRKKALLDRLAAEYEAEVSAISSAKARGEEVCEMCSS
jgi:ribonucleoside-diphosphate reductase alpha chain